MIDVLILTAWMTVGIIAALVLAEHRGSRWGHVPMAMILGPLWIPIALDKRGAPE